MSRGVCSGESKVAGGSKAFCEPEVGGVESHRARRTGQPWSGCSPRGSGDPAGLYSPPAQVTDCYVLGCVLKFWVSSLFFANFRSGSQRVWR